MPRQFHALQYTMENITSSSEASRASDDLNQEPTLSPYDIGTIPPMFASVGLALVIAFGIMGNLIIITVFLTCKQLRTPPNLFIINLAMGDLIFILSSSTTLNSMLQNGRMLYGYTGCLVIALFIIISASVTLTTMGLIAISWYIAIVHPQKKNLLSWGRCAALSSLSWLYPCVLLVPTPLGWGRLGYHRAGWVCTFDWSYNLEYNFVLFSATQVVTSVIMIFCYVNIYWVFRQSRKRVTGENVKEKGPKKEEIRLAIQLLVIFAIYNACWGPFFLVALIIDPQGALPTWVYGIFTIGYLWNSAVNVLVYLYYNKVFRAQVFKLIGINIEG